MSFDRGDQIRYASSCGGGACFYGSATPHPKGQEPRRSQIVLESHLCSHIWCKTTTYCLIIRQGKRQVFLHCNISCNVMGPAPALPSVGIPIYTHSAGPFNVQWHKMCSGKLKVYSGIIKAAVQWLKQTKENRKLSEALGERKPPPRKLMQ